MTQLETSPLAEGKVLGNGGGGSSRERNLDRLVVGLSGLLAVVLALIGLDGRSLWLDESATAAIVSQHGHALWSGIAHDGGNMAGYYVLLHVLVVLFGTHTAVLRLPSVLGVGLGSGALALFALRLYGRRSAIAAGLLSAVSMPAIFWAQNARSYTLMVAFVTCSFLFFRSLALGDPRRAVVIGYVVATTLALYMSYVSLFIVPAQLLALAGTKRSLRRLFAPLLAIALLCIPLLALALHRGSGQLFWIPRPALTDVTDALESLTSAGYQPNFALSATALPLLWITLVALAASAVLAVGEGKRIGNERRFDAQLVVSWLVVPFALLLVESYVAQPVFSERNLLGSLPAASLLLARGITDKRLGRAGALAALGGFVVLRGLQLLPSYDASSEPWNTVTSALLEHATPNSCVAFYPEDGEMAVAYYARSSDAAKSLRVVLPDTSLVSLVPHVEQYVLPSSSHLRSISMECSNLFLIGSHSGQPNGTVSSQADYRNYVTLQRELASLYPSESTERYGWAAVITVNHWSR